MVVWLATLPVRLYIYLPITSSVGCGTWHDGILRSILVQRAPIECSDFRRITCSRWARLDAGTLATTPSSVRPKQQHPKTIVRDMRIACTALMSPVPALAQIFGKPHTCHLPFWALACRTNKGMTLLGTYHQDLDNLDIHLLGSIISLPATVSPQWFIEPWCAETLHYSGRCTDGIHRSSRQRCSCQLLVARQVSRTHPVPGSCTLRRPTTSTHIRRQSSSAY